MAGLLDPGSTGSKILSLLTSLPSIAAPGSQGPTDLTGMDAQLDPTVKAGLAAQYRNRYMASLGAQAEKGNTPWFAVDSTAAAPANDDYQTGVQNAIKAAGAIKQARIDAQRQANLDEAMRTQTDPAKKQALGIMDLTQAGDVMGKEAFGKDNDNYSMTAVGDGSAIILDKRAGTHQIVSLGNGAASKFPKGTRFNYIAGENRYVYMTPDGKTGSQSAPEDPHANDPGNLDMQYYRIASGLPPIGRVTGAALQHLVAGAPAWAAAHGMTMQDFVIHGINAHAADLTIRVNQRQATAAQTALGSLENNYKTLDQVLLSTNLHSVPVNSVLNWTAKELSGNPQRIALRGALEAVVGDWARVQSGNLGNAGADVSSMQHSRELFGAAFSGATFDSLHKIIRADAAGKIASYANQNQILQNSIMVSTKEGSANTEADTEQAPPGY